jgi:hypothetical protein
LGEEGRGDEACEGTNAAAGTRGEKRGEEETRGGDIRP